MSKFNIGIRFTEEEQGILRQASFEVGVDNTGGSKDIPIPKCIIEVTEGSIYYDWDNFRDYEGLPSVKVPTHLVGYWKMEDTYFTESDTMWDCLSKYKRVRCKPVSKMVTVWEEVK